MVRRMKAQIVHRGVDGSEHLVFPPRTVEGIPVALRGEENELLRKVASYCSRAARSAQGTEEAELVGFAMQIVKKRALSSRAALETTITHPLEALKQPDDETPPSRAEIRDLEADLPLDEASAERTAARLIRSAIPKEEKRRKAEIKALNGIRSILKGLPATDPKIQTLLCDIGTILAEHPEEKVIVFTEYLDTLEAIRQDVESVPAIGGAYAILRGGLSPRQRQRVQQQFEQPEVQVLLATDAASEGLNLQRHCHRVYHVELPWNPNRLEQRNGRVDRYGRRRNPEIRYLYYPDSPEDDVLHQLTAKIEQMHGDRVSTPDILGVLRGAGELQAGLVDLDPEDHDLIHARHRWFGILKIAPPTSSATYSPW
jgi:SNF2 family DNA or RNA helicase